MVVLGLKKSNSIVLQLFLKNLCVNNYYIPNISKVTSNFYLQVLTTHVGTSKILNFKVMSWYVKNNGIANENELDNNNNILILDIIITNINY